MGKSEHLHLLTQPGALAELRAERARKSFHAFFRDIAWPVLQPATMFKDNWHIHAVCEHLEAVKNGEIRKLCINMPFRMLKSSLVSQAFPAWDWLDNPSRQFLTASYAGEVATRDAVDTRRIIDSPAYKVAYGDCFRLTTDQNVKTFYENDRRGMRKITSTDGAGTGFGGDIRIVDDPVSAKNADSMVHLLHSIEWWKGTMATRANDPETGAVILVHQRLNSNDLSGYVLEKERNWVHLVLPFRYDPALRKTTSLGFVDPRKKEGELIHPARLGEESAKDLETTLGEYHKNAQLQQNPKPRGGVIFKRGNWQFYRVRKLNKEYDEIAITLDAAFKDLQSSDYVAIQAWGRIGSQHYLLHRVKDHLGFNATCMALKTVALLFPEAVAILVEDKANGTAVIESMRNVLSGVIAISPEGGKVARAYAMEPDQEAGNIWLPDPELEPTIEVFLTEVSAFPGVEHDDETDAMTQYVNWSRARFMTMGLMEHMKAEAEARRAAEE